MMVKKPQVLKCVLSALLFCFLARDVSAYKTANPAKKPKKNTAQIHKSASSSGARHSTALRDFNKLRHFKSYDPATDQWSTIEDFETVDILEDNTEQREDRYIYRSFWAYDVVKNCWYKVDIRDYGYRLGKIAATESEEESQKSSGFWKNCTLGFSVGPGLTFYENKIADCTITERDGDFFLQTKKGEQNGTNYKINWFGAGYTQCGDPLAASKGALSVRKSQAGEKIIFQGRGWSIPMTLFTHYSFCKRLRVGAGCELELNYLKELTLKESVSHLKPFEVQSAHQWFYNIAWFGMLGFKVIHAPHYDVVVDVKLGKNYNAGASPKDIFSGEGHIYSGWLSGIGIAYEHDLNNYFRLLARMSGNWKIHNDVPSNMQDPQASVKLNQVGIHLDLGVQVSFAKKTEREGVESLYADHDLIQPQ